MSTVYHWHSAESVDKTAIQNCLNIIIIIMATEKEASQCSVAPPMGRRGYSHVSSSSSLLPFDLHVCPLVLRYAESVDKTAIQNCLNIIIIIMATEKEASQCSVAPPMGRRGYSHVSSSSLLPFDLHVCPLVLRYAFSNASIFCPTLLLRQRPK